VIAVNGAGEAPVLGFLVVAAVGDGGGEKASLQAGLAAAVKDAVLGVAVIPNAGEDKASVLGVPVAAAAGGGGGEKGSLVGENNAEGVPVIAAEGEGEVSVQGDPVAPAVDRKGEAPVAQAVAAEGNGKAEKDEEGIKWLKHYSSAQSILVVGDGDFSFSLALATAFGSGRNLVATSLDSYGSALSSTRPSRSQRSSSNLKFERCDFLAIYLVCIH
jgi:25S rRNA (uracil2634-N3)-methyltransferase